MTTQAELVQQLNSLGETVVSVRDELVGDIGRLQETIANSSNVPQEVVDAANSLAAKVDSLAALDIPNPVVDPPAEDDTEDEDDSETPPAEGNSGEDIFQ